MLKPFARPADARTCPLGSRNRLARLHPDGRVRAADHRAGRGCTLVDIDGRAYLDGVSSLWCNIHGHRHPRLDAALRDQLERVAHVTSLGASNPTTIGWRSGCRKSRRRGWSTFLFRRRRDGRGSGAEDGLSILAAAVRSATGKDAATWRWATHIMATRWGGQRGRRRAISRHVSAAVVRGAAHCPRRTCTGLPPGVTRRDAHGALFGRGWNGCWPTNTSGSPRW